MSYRGSHTSCTHDAGGQGRVSSGIGVGKKSGQQADPMAYRRMFRDRWAVFLHANFHNHLHVAIFFSVDEKTARHWWNHVNEPKGWAVSYARDHIPGAGAALREAAAA